MMTILGCIAYQHNIRLVFLAVLIGAVGSWVTARLFHRAAHTTGRQRAGWHVLTAVTAGAAIWCTHFVAMLGFDAGAPVGFDPTLTFVSLLIAVVGSAAGFALAGSGRMRFAPAIGGAVVGLAIMLMHYTGMMAYRVQGIVSWDMSYLTASILLSVGLSSAALHFGTRTTAHAEDVMAGVLTLAIAALHFTGMTAFRVEPMATGGVFFTPEALHVLALAAAGVAIGIVVTGLVSYLIDNSARAESYEHLRRMALNDSLTSLPNRAHFNERLNAELGLARHTGGKVALIGIDLNRFKEINDLRGHNAGDEVLRILARRMTGLQRDGEFVARVGGDEFAAIHRIGSRAELLNFLSRLEAALFRPIRIEDYEVVPGASFGVAIYPDDATSSASLISDADLAMYRAKSGLSGRICFYEASMDESVRTRRCLGADLRQAMGRGQLSLHYQAQSSVATGQVQGYEALLRWEHPQHGFISPLEFIPIAEENGLILQIGEWALKTACAAAACWEPPCKVAVNLSAVQFAHADLPSLVREILAQTGLAPQRLELELTESTIFADRKRALHILSQIKALGVSIALDDFGTGYSSLDTLRSFPFDRIKLDRSFISEIEFRPQAKAIVRAVLALGKSLDIAVLAEGIETQSQLALLATEGCDEAQGFLLGRPASLDRIVASGALALTGDRRWKEQFPKPNSAELEG